MYRFAQRCLNIIFIVIDVSQIYWFFSRTQEDFEAIETKHGNRTLRGQKYFLNIRHTINQVMCMCSKCKNQVTLCSLFLRHLVDHDFELQIVLIKRLDSFLFKYESVSLLIIFFCANLNGYINTSSNPKHIANLLVLCYTLDILSFAPYRHFNQSCESLLVINGAQRIIYSDYYFSSFYTLMV